MCVFYPAERNCPLPASRSSVAMRSKRVWPAPGGVLEKRDHSRPRLTNRRSAPGASGQLIVEGQFARASIAGEAAGLGDGSGDGCGPGMGADSARAQPVTQRARAASSAANLFRFILILSRFWSSFCPHCTLSPASAQQGLCGPAARAAINIHRPSRWFFICGHSPMFFATRRTRNTVCQLREIVTCCP